MSNSLQIFIYETQGITSDNNYPLLYFQTVEDKHRFISKLVSHPHGNLLNQYFVINNPQLLPREIREQHMYNNEVDNS